jgi:hypothetical protein
VTGKYAKVIPKLLVGSELPLHEIISALHEAQQPGFNYITISY